MNHLRRCWKDRHEHATEVHGFGSPEWAESHLADSATCMLDAGHDGPHEFTPDDRIVIRIVDGPAINDHPDGCHTTDPVELHDCESDGHYSCRSCSRRVERDQ